MRLVLRNKSGSRKLLLAFALLAALACAGPAGKEGPAGDAGPPGPPGPSGPPGNTGIVDYGVLTPDELEVAQIKAVVTGVSIPADGRPVVNLTVTERHGSGVKGMSASAVGWRFALIKLDPAGNGTAAGAANDNWVSYMASNDHSSSSTETASTSGLTDNGDGTYVYRFTKNVTAGPTAAGTTYEPSKVHRLVVLISATDNPFSPVNIVKDFTPSTGVDTTGQYEKVDQSACLECHTTFRAIAGATGQLGTGDFHGGARFDVRTCIACHNDQKRFSVTSSGGPDTPVVASDLTWAGDMAVMNTETVMNFPVFVHRIHMGHRLSMTGMKNPPVMNDLGGTFVGYERPYNVTYPQDVRNCVKCHRSPAPLQDHWKTAPSRRACGACHDNISFVSPAPAGRRGHTGGPQANDNSCLLCHADGASAGIPVSHVPVSPPNPNNIYDNPTTGTSNTNAAWVAAAGAVPRFAKVITYEVSSASLNAARNPQIVFRFMIADPTANPPAPATPVVFPVFGTGPTELIPNFVGSPSVFFAYAVPQDGISEPADFNVTASGYIRNIWNGSATGSAAGTLTGPDANGFYTIVLTGVTIPSSATMLTGGVGYTYALGSPPLFTNNVQPLTQTNLSPYPYTPNSNATPGAQAGRGGLIVPPTDVSKAATNFTARRAIVDNTKCSACHVSLGVGPDFHAGQRNDAATCNFCHTPNKTSSGWSANQKDFVHSIHGAEKRTVHFTWKEVSPTQGYWQTTYPAVLNRCTTCHLDGTFDFSMTSTTDALPKMLFTTAGQGTYAPGSVHSPYVDENVDYGSGFKFDSSTGTSTQADLTTLVTSPIVAACSACHDTVAAVDHMKTNGGSFWEPRSTARAKPVEQCLICHGPGRIADISVVHTDKTP